MLHKRFNFMILVRIKQYALYINYKFFILPKSQKFVVADQIRKIL